MEGSSGGRNTEDFKVIFVFGDRKDPFSPPNIDDGVGDHARIATGTSSTKRVCMINEELTSKALNNKPWLVGRQDGAGTMELFDVQSTSLGPRWSKSNLSVCMSDVA